VIATTTSLSVTCTNGTSYNVGLNAGTASGATVTTRAMTGPGGATLSYALYQDSGHSTNWGNTVGTDTKSGTGDGSAQTMTVYGNLSANQYPTPGSLFGYDHCHHHILIECQARANDGFSTSTN
jgi:spore coat protein U-like protein